MQPASNLDPDKPIDRAYHLPDLSCTYTGSFGQRTPLPYKVCEAFSEVGIYAMILFGPWAFGSTDKWAIWIMTSLGLFLGALLVGKWMIRWRMDFTPIRWGARPNHEFTKAHRALIRLLAILTVLVLAYGLVGTLNARGTFDRRTEVFTALDRYIGWLPASFGRSQSWFFFWNYLGMAFAFWATRDWLLTKTSREKRLQSQSNTTQTAQRTEPKIELADRLRRLMWVLCLNGAILALVCIAQRLSGTSKLLWLAEPWKNKDPMSQFGPYAYRSNAAQYLNLLWPMCLGFWATLRKFSRRNHHRKSRLGGKVHIWLLPCAVLMGPCPIISTSRGGAAICLLLLLAIIPILLFAHRKETYSTRIGILFLIGLMILFGGILGWKPLAQRLQKRLPYDLSGRITTYENARKIVQDYPGYGTGIGTFGVMYHFYREDGQGKFVYCHDDWLETRVTFGLVGIIPILLMLLLVGLSWFFPGPIVVPWVLPALITAAMVGCLIHANFDFPLQINSILHLFLLSACLLLSLRCGYRVRSIRLGDPRLARPEISVL